MESEFCTVQPLPRHAVDMRQPGVVALGVNLQDVTRGLVSIFFIHCNRGVGYLVFFETAMVFVAAGIPKPLKQLLPVVFSSPLEGPTLHVCTNDIDVYIYI